MVDGIILGILSRLCFLGILKILAYLMYNDLKTLCIDENPMKILWMKGRHVYCMYVHTQWC